MTYVKPELFVVASAVDAIHSNPDGDPRSKGSLAIDNQVLHTHSTVSAYEADE